MLFSYAGASSVLRYLYSVILFLYTAVSSRFETLSQLYITFVHCSILQISDTFPTVYYFRTLLYPPDFRHFSSCILFSYTAVSSRFQTLSKLYINFVHCCIHQILDTFPAVYYFVHCCILQILDTFPAVYDFRTLLYPQEFRRFPNCVLILYTAVSSKF